MEDDYYLNYDDEDEQNEKHRKFVEDIEECCIMIDTAPTLRPAIEKELTDLADRFHGGDVARLTPHGMSRIGNLVALDSCSFAEDIIYAMLYKNENRPDRYIPSPPSEVDNEPEETPAEPEIFDDWDLKDYTPDPATAYVEKCDQITDQFLNAVIRSVKTLAAEHFPSEIMTLSADGYRFLDETIFEIADDFTAGVANLIYKDRFIDGYKQLVLWTSDRSFTLPHCRPERLDPSLLDEHDAFHTNLYLENDV